MNRGIVPSSSSVLSWIGVSLILWAAPSLSSGTSLYVGTESPAGSGSILGPFERIQDALDAALFGDTVRVARGAYVENIEMKPGVALVGSGARWTWIIGAEPGRPVIEAAEDILIRGFALQQSGDHLAVVMLRGSERVSARISDNVILHRGRTADVHGSRRGIWGWGKEGWLTISRNVLTDATTGILFTSLFNGSGVTVRISNNILYDIDAGIDVAHVRDVELVNNTIYLNEDARSVAVYIEAERSLKVINNIVVNRAKGYGFGMWLRLARPEEEVGYEVLYNDVWGIGGNYREVEGGEGSLPMDPMFVDVERRDFRLSSDSPCRDAGHPDLRYRDRDGTRNDMGAYGGPEPLEFEPPYPTAGIEVPSVSGAVYAGTPVSEVPFAAVLTYGTGDLPACAGPLWCHGSTIVARRGDDVYVAALETLRDCQPLNNCRWLLYRRGSDGWHLIHRDETGRTREPSPIALLGNGDLLVSANPTLTAPDRYSRPAEPTVFRFDTDDITDITGAITKRTDMGKAVWRLTGRHQSEVRRMVWTR